MSMSDPMLGVVWHYTVGKSYTEIACDGFIKLGTALICKRERPVVWFSTNPVWEATVNKFWRNGDGTHIELTKEKTAELGGGLVRIAVRPKTAPVTWTIFKRESGIDPKKAKELERTALVRFADPREWRCSWVARPSDKWIAVETWKDGRWTALPIER